MTNRASGTMALPPAVYGPAKGSVHSGVPELERFAPITSPQEHVFEEYLGNKSMMPSRHRAALSKSSGLMELHYNTMRKKALERAAWPSAIVVPSMDRPFNASAGYSGFIPGKISSNICGCSHKVGNQLSYETRGKHFDPPMSGMQFTLGAASPSSLMRSQSLPQITVQ